MNRFTLAAAALFALAVAGPAQGDTILFTLNNNFNGDMPIGTLSATVTDIVGGVQLSLNASNLNSAQKISDWAFNVNYTTLTSSNFTFISGSTTPQTIQVGPGLTIPGTGSAGGTFNINFDFLTSNSGAFFGGNTIVYNISGLTTAMFTVPLSQISATAKWYTATHIQSIPGADSGALGTATYTNAVPEPASVAMALTAVGALGLVSLRRRARTA